MPSGSKRHRWTVPLAAVLAVALGILLWLLLREPGNRSGRGRKPDRSSETRPMRSAVRARLLQAPKGSISGTVRDDKGAPVSGAVATSTASTNRTSPKLSMASWRELSRPASGFWKL